MDDPMDETDEDSVRAEHEPAELASLPPRPEHVGRRSYDSVASSYSGLGGGGGASGEYYAEASADEGETSGGEA